METRCAICRKHTRSHRIDVGQVWAYICHTCWENEQNEINKLKTEMEKVVVPTEKPNTEQKPAGDIPATAKPIDVHNDDFMLKFTAMQYGVETLKEKLKKSKCWK